MKINDRVKLPNNEGLGTIIILQGHPALTAWVNCDHAPTGYSYFEMGNGIITVKKYSLDSLKEIKMGNRYIIKTRKIPGRGGDAPITEYYIVDTRDHSQYPGGAGISEFEVAKLCNFLNTMA